MRWFNLLAPGMAVAACVAALAQTSTYNLGRTPNEEEIRSAGILIDPAGKELPPGSGTAQQGAPIYAQKCAACHGPNGEGGGPLGPRLVGGKGTFNTPLPVKTIGSYWPYATTIWDYIRRAMPPKGEGTLNADEVYALTAVLLYRNGIIKEDDVLDATSLPKVPMPNRNGFLPSRLEWKAPSGNP